MTFYTVLQSAVEGIEILLLPVRVSHVENTRTWLPALLLYIPLRRITFKAITLVNVACVFRSSSRLQQ